MDPQIRTIGSVNVIDLDGRLTVVAKETDGMGAAIRDLLHAGRKRILLNMENVAWIDSSGLGVLVAHYKRALERGGVIKILRPSQKVRTILVASKLDDVLELFDDENEAIGSF